MTRRWIFSTAIIACAVVASASSAARPTVTDSIDQVVEWNQVFNETVLATTPAPNSLVTSRSAGLLAAAVFDAVNGIARKYEPVLVTTRAPVHASARAAAVQAACSMLVRLYPAQAAVLTARRDASVAALGGAGSWESQASIERGLFWGQSVADAVWAAGQNDGFAPPMPPFTGSATLGFWRPTPPANSPGSGPQFATMTPWVLTRPSQFRPPPPPALTSTEYATDYNETRQWGAASGSMRQQADSDIASFWSGNGTLFWTRIAVELASDHRRSLVENARLFALLHISLADASIATWDAKYRYLYWRPVTAIRSLDDDGNPATEPDPSWTPFLTTSAHPEYPSGHSNLAGAATTVLVAIFGDDASFDATSEIMPGTVRSFVGFEGAVDEMIKARIYGGMHFRTACVRGAALGSTVAEYVMRHAMRQKRGDWDDRSDWGDR